MISAVAVLLGTDRDQTTVGFFPAFGVTLLDARDAPVVHACSVAVALKV